MTVTPKEDTSEPDLSIDLPSVSKQNWKTAESRDFWSQYFEPGTNMLADTFRAATLDADHPRTGYLRVVQKDNVFEFIQDTDEAGLSVTPVDSFEGSDREQYAVAVDEKTSNTLAQAVDEQDFEALGDVFGQPACCREHTATWREKDTTDPVYEIACNTPSAYRREGETEEIVVEEPHHILNVMWSYLGWQFVSFYPCSFECDEAREVAIKNGKLMREIGVSDEADQLFQFLAEPASWSGYHGLTHVKNSHCIGSYDCDNRWEERKVVWKDDHSAKAACGGN